MISTASATAVTAAYDDAFYTYPLYSLVGTYAMEARGELEIYIRIERENSCYFMYENKDGYWLKGAMVAPVSRTTLEGVLKKPANISFVGLGNEKLAIFRMPPGWQNGRFQTKTGYWLATIMGSVELYKQ